MPEPVRHEWTAADHIREAEDALAYLGQHDDPRNPGYGPYATAALAHAVLGLAIIHNGGSNPAAIDLTRGY